MPRLQSIAAAALLALAALSPTWAADTPEPATKANNLTAARAQIAQKNWAAAVTELKKVNDTGSADWNNLMGYSVRKGPTPDYAAAGRYYDAALRIDPTHRGALEYSGELFLILGDLPRAEERQARLAKICTAPCEELEDLQAAIARYKAAGNKYVPQP
jgi:tetratricopeptide (TPR) repeat protein